MDAKTDRSGDTERPIHVAPIRPVSRPAAGESVLERYSAHWGSPHGHVPMTNASDAVLTERVIDALGYILMETIETTQELKASVAEMEARLPDVLTARQRQMLAAQRESMQTALGVLSMTESNVRAQLAQLGVPALPLYGEGQPLDPN